MNTQFFSNCIRLVRFHWRMEKKHCLHLFLMLFFIFLFKYIFVDFVMARIMSYQLYTAFGYIFNEEWIYWGFMLIAVSYLFAAFNHKEQAIDYLSLPANPAEKFITRVVFGTIAIALIAFTARMAANLVFISLIGVIDMLAGNQPDWGQLFRYFGLPGHWKFAGICTGHMTLGQFLMSFVWINTIALWPLSLFTLFGLWFRKMGWVYALAFLFVGTTVAYLVTEIWLSHTNPIDRSTLQTGFMFFCLFFSLVHYVLAYCSFRRSQIVSYQYINL